MKKTSLLMVFIALAMLFSGVINQIQAQNALVSLSKVDAQTGRIANYQLLEKDVDHIFSLYKMAKKKNGAIDESVHTALRLVLIQLFKENPQKTSKQLKVLRIVGPGMVILKKLVTRDKTPQEPQIAFAVNALLDEVTRRLDAKVKPAIVVK